MSNPFSFYSPTKIVFGKGAELQTGALVRQFGGAKALLVYGGGSAKKSGVLDRVASSLREAGIGCAQLGGVVPNPLLSKVREGISLARAESADFIVGVGGGSAIDTAKAIAYGLADDGDVWDFYEHTRSPKASLPVGAVLTIAAAGSEMSDSSVITDEASGKKRGCNSDLCRPKFAVMNPELTLTLPDYQTQAGCADMMMHTMERYFTNGGNMEITDALAEGLLRTVMRHALVLRRNPADYEARAEVMWASSLAHNGLTGCGNGGNDFATHRIEHELGGMFNVTHGAGLTAVWGTWARYVHRDCLPRFVKFAVNVMGIAPQGTDEATALSGIAAMEDFFRAIGMPVSITELGVSPTDAQLREMAARCRDAVGGHCGSAKVLYEQDFYNIYKGAM